MTDPSGHVAIAPWDLLDIVSFGASLNDFIREPTLVNASWLALDAVGLLPLLPGLGVVHHLGKLDEVGRAARGLSDEEQIARIYGTLRSTEAGEQIYRTASKNGLPTVVFDDVLEVGHWGYYDKELNLIGLNPVYRISPPELGAATLGHELAHRTARWFSGSQSNEFFAHMVEASVWRELQERIIIPSRFTGAQIRALRSHNKVLALANASRDGSALMGYLRNHPHYAGYPISSKNLWNDSLWNFYTRPRGR